MPEHPFDVLEADDLRHESSAKWTHFPPDVLPLWVADMDYPVAPEIMAALRARLDRSVGYAPFPGETRLTGMLLERHRAEGTHLKLLPGVVPGLYAAVQGLTSPGDEVVTLTPVYPPFLSAVTDHGRVLRSVPLARGPRHYEIDWDALEAAITPATRLLMVCNPHNPTGRVWTRAELEGLADLAVRHRLWVVSDELHADLTLDGGFRPLASLGAEIAARTVTLVGPCKAYNTAGLGIGAAIGSEAVVARLEAATHGIMGHPSALAQTMWRAALEGGAAWLAGTLDYLRGNRDFLGAYLAEHLPQVGYLPPQATYLAWLDFRALGLEPDPQTFLLERAKVGLNAGPTFGPGGEGHVRLNFATSRALLTEALDRVRDAVAAVPGR